MHKVLAAAFLPLLIGTSAHAYSYHSAGKPGDYVVVDRGETYVINCRNDTLIRVANPKRVPRAFKTPLGRKFCTDMANW